MVCVTVTFSCWLLQGTVVRRPAKGSLLWHSRDVVCGFQGRWGSVVSVCTASCCSAFSASHTRSSAGQPGAGDDQSALRGKRAGSAHGLPHLQPAGVRRETQDVHGQQGHQPQSVVRHWAGVLVLLQEKPASQIHVSVHLYTSDAERCVSCELISTSCAPAPRHLGKKQQEHPYWGVTRSNFSHCCLPTERRERCSLESNLEKTWVPVSSASSMVLYVAFCHSNRKQQQQREHPTEVWLEATFWHCCPTVQDKKRKMWSESNVAAVGYLGQHRTSLLLGYLDLHSVFSIVQVVLQVRFLQARSSPEEGEETTHGSGNWKGQRNHETERGGCAASLKLGKTTCAFEHSSMCKMNLHHTPCRGTRPPLNLSSQPLFEPEILTTCCWFNLCKWHTICASDMTWSGVAPDAWFISSEFAKILGVAFHSLTHV